MPLTIAERKARLDKREKQMKTAVNLRAQGKTWFEIAETIGVKSHQRAMQIHRDAVHMGINAAITGAKRLVECPVGRKE
jgi:hypothetical protein